jgi:hypothetical protein
MDVCEEYCEELLKLARFGGTFLQDSPGNMHPIYSRALPVHNKYRHENVTIV